MHELPQLRKLVVAHADVLTVIGVQSPKYTAEAVLENLTSAVERYGIEHPVINDPNFVVWDAFAVKAWPTLIFVSPLGTVVGIQEGEATFTELDQVVSRLLATYERDGVLGHFDEPRCKAPTRPLTELAFPGAVEVANGALYIADSGHHRVLACDPDGCVTGVFGGDQPGFLDGNATSARFNDPHGMAHHLGTDTLYIADAGNHVIRAIDLGSGNVRTVAGTGEQARRVLRTGPARTKPLSSPWDLALNGNMLYIAMAGLHQVWVLDLITEELQVFAGTGHESLSDGPRERAWLAQPMSIAICEESLYVVSAESQAIQCVDLRIGSVRTLIGKGLFEFGDRDGLLPEALLQHPQGIVASKYGLLLADTYNHKIKTLDESAGRSSTKAGSGMRGYLDGPGINARFAGPTGMAVEGDTAYIADTDNHLVRLLDVASGSVRTLRVSFNERK